jgi:hypothetical protein
MSHMKVTPLSSCLGQNVEFFRVIVDRRASLERMINDGRYDRVYPLVMTVRYRRLMGGRKEVEIALVQFQHTFAPSEVKRLMKSHGYRPAYIEELLALGRDYPDLQRRIPIVAIGSGIIVQRRRRAVCLSGGVSSRELGTQVIYRRWSPYYRFAFVNDNKASAVDSAWGGGESSRGL